MAGEPLCEYYLHPDRSLIPTAVRLGHVLYMGAVTGHDADGILPQGGFGPQCRQALMNMRALLRQAGSGLADVAYVGVYFRDVALRSVLNDIWVEFYPCADARPPHIYVPAELPPDLEAQLQVIALPGEPRKVLEIPGLKHQDPMSMGASMGGFVFSSRLFSSEAFTDRSAGSPREQAEMVLRHARTLMEQAGGSIAGLRQVTAFVSDASLDAALRQAWSKTFAAGVHPDLQILRVKLGDAPSIRIAITGSV